MSRHRLRQPIADAGQQHEVRAAAPFADPAQVLLHRRPMARQSSPLGAGPGRHALGDERPWPGDPSPVRTDPADAPARRDDDHVTRIGDGRVEQLDLQADDRVEPGRLRGARRNGPRRTGPAWSVTARPVSPSSTARSTRSSAGDAPSRNEKLVWQWSSAYGVGATARSGGPAMRGLVSIEHLFESMRPSLPGTNGGLDRCGETGFPWSMRPLRPSGRRSAPVWLALLLVAITLPTAGLTGDVPDVRAATEIRPRVTGIKPLSHEVYGYLPYWRLDSGSVDRIRFDLVSTIAFFGLGIKSTGAIDRNWVGYKEYVGDAAAAVTNAAHDRGVRVVPTFQLFDSSAGYAKMTKFLKSPAAQNRFIKEALDLMAERKADGAGLDFEPVGALNPLGKYYVPFVQKFRTAMKKRFPSSTLVNALSAGGSERIIKGLVGVVDHQMVMTYNYRWKGSTITGAIAPLANATRNVQIHMDRILQWAPAKSLLLGVPYYGYDWPVTTKDPNAKVRKDKKLYGAVKSVTYASARDFLKAHPKVVRRYDAREGSAFYTYWSTKYKTHRQVYFEDERSAAAKYDYAILKGLGGVGVWTLENDNGYPQMWNVLRDKFYAPIRKIDVKGGVREVDKRAGRVSVVIRLYARQLGTVPQRGVVRWTIRNASGRLLDWGQLKRKTLYPKRLSKRVLRVDIGTAAGLRAGTYTLRVRFISSSKTYYAPVVEFRQPY